MKKALYKVYFKATETLGNGNERRILKEVYMPRFDGITKKHITEEQRIERGTRALQAEHYYNIQYGSTIATQVIFADRWDADTINEFVKRLEGHYPHSQSVMNTIAKVAREMMEEK